MDRDLSTTGAMRRPGPHRAHVLTTLSVAPGQAPRLAREQRTLPTREQVTTAQAPDLDPAPEPTPHRREQPTLPAREQAATGHAPYAVPAPELVAQGREQRTLPTCGQMTSNRAPETAPAPEPVAHGRERRTLLALATVTTANAPDAVPTPEPAEHGREQRRLPTRGQVTTGQAPDTDPAAELVAQGRDQRTLLPLASVTAGGEPASKASAAPGVQPRPRIPAVAACGQVGTRQRRAFPGRAIPGMLEGRGVSGDGQRTLPGPATPTVMVPAVRMVRVMAGPARGRRERARAEVAG